MQAGKWIAAGIIITLGFVVLAFTIGWFISGFGYWGKPNVIDWGRTESKSSVPNGEETVSGTASGMFGTKGNLQCEIIPVGSTKNHLIYDIEDDNTGECDTQKTSMISSTYSNAGYLSINAAYDILEYYITELDAEDMAIIEVIEFENSFYAGVQDVKTGIGAMELLVDKSHGTVSPEMGPNMMWNTKYGMHSRGMMVQRNTQINTLSEAAVLNIAQEWLSRQSLRLFVGGHIDPFYGYYTLHIFQDDEIQGVLSVHARTGQVWYHTWHGDFIQILVKGGLQ